MKFTKPMIDLAKEIRRRAPSELKPTIKMANPLLFEELGKIYHATSDAIMKALIKDLCEQAGEPWTSVLKQREPVSNEQTDSLMDRLSLAHMVRETKPKDAPKRIYRGQVIEG